MSLLKEYQKVDLSIIEKTVCEHYDVSPEYLFMKTRRDHVVSKRQIFHYFSYILNKPKITYKDIGNYSKDYTYGHATIINSIKKVSNYIDNEPKFAQEVNLILSKIFLNIKIQSPESIAIRKDIIEIICEISNNKNREQLNKFLLNKIKL